MKVYLNFEYFDIDHKLKLVFLKMMKNLLYFDDYYYLENFLYYLNLN